MTIEFHRGTFFGESIAQCHTCTDEGSRLASYFKWKRLDPLQYEGSVAGIPEEVVLVAKLHEMRIKNHKIVVFAETIPEPK